MSQYNQKIEKIKKYAKSMFLGYIYSNVATELENANTTNMSNVDFLHDLMQKEFDLRLENGKKARIKKANFPYKKYLADLKRENLPVDGANKLQTLETLEFIKENQNIVLAGNPGTGKTHIAIGLGMKACMEGYKVLFVTVPMLVNRLKEGKANLSLSNLYRQFECYDLIIMDELGYISFDKEGGELLFTLISLRAEKKSTLITTNLSFDKWEEIFNDPVMTSAIIDRLTHKSHVINMTGESYRLKETMGILNK